MPSFSGEDSASRAWRRQQMELSNDISGLPRDPYAAAMVAGLDALELTGEQRLVAITSYFKALARNQEAHLRKPPTALSESLVNEERSEAD